MAIALIYKLILILSFIVGAIWFFKPQVPDYYKMIVLGIGCYSLSELFWLVYYICTGAINSDGCGVSALGYFGFYMFMLSAVLSEAAFVDKTLKNRLIYSLPVFIAPILIVTLIVFVNIKTLDFTVVTIMRYICFIPLVIVSYFNLKYAVMPKCEKVSIPNFRLCNVICLVFCVLDILYSFFSENQFEELTLLFGILISLSLLLLVILLKRGYAKRKP